MGKKLVIVESPAKAKTIRRFLGDDYIVEASIGHIRDLPLNRKGLPEELRKKWWSDFAVDVDNGFEPFYEVPNEKKRVIDGLKAALKQADTLVLATDEDREGESISWHLLKVLNPKKGMPIQRIAFHELTKEAVLDAIRNPRPIDEKLVEAQEARRILDRLYGYTLSPVLWRLLAPDLSAGRVQSPAVKLIVERERERAAFVSSTYWDLKADLKAEKSEFQAQLKLVNGQRVAEGKDFDDTTGKLLDEKALLLDEDRASTMALTAASAKPWKVASVDKSPGQEKAPQPFRTTTLQQEANRKFGFPAEVTMRLAQDLYEGVDLGGERVGLITYMRTDSLTLAEAALKQIRDVVSELYGGEFLPEKPIRYKAKVVNAQEAHEAIRPTDLRRTPDSVKKALTSLSDRHFKLYDLIWKRTVACQMKPAEVMRTSARIEVQAGKDALQFLATGKEILFPGFLRAYVEGSDDPEAELEGKERILPTLKQGQVVEAKAVEPLRHETRPPARYTDASLIKRLEELGIGRPSTYASILSVIVDRGYIRKQGRELIPTFTAFLTMEVLDKSFGEFLDLKFTATMDDQLDQIANGKTDSKTYLRGFFLGDDRALGLWQAVEERKKQIPYPVSAIGNDPESGAPIVVRLGKDGNAFLQMGEESKRYANIPDDLAPADLKPDKAMELLNATKEGPVSVGTHPQTGRRLLLRQRQGFYLEVERTADEIADKVKPTWVSVPPGVDPRELSQDDLDFLCQLPREIGKHSESGEAIVFRIGKFGPYVQAGSEIRNVDDWRNGLTMTAAEAETILAQPKTFGRQKAAASPREPIQNFGEVEGAAGPVRVLAGRFGPYVTDGTTNATIPKNQDPTTLTREQAIQLLDAKRAAGPAPKRRGRGRATTTRTATKRTTAKKTTRTKKS